MLNAKYELWKVIARGTYIYENGNEVLEEKVAVVQTWDYPLMPFCERSLFSKWNPIMAYKNICNGKKKQLIPTEITLIDHNQLYECIINFVIKTNNIARYIWSIFSSRWHICKL